MSTCPSCRRSPEPGEEHLILIGTSGPEDSPEPEYICVGAGEDGGAAVLAPQPSDWPADSPAAF